MSNTRSRNTPPPGQYRQSARPIAVAAAHKTASPVASFPRLQHCADSACMSFGRVEQRLMHSISPWFPNRNQALAHARARARAHTHTHAHTFHIQVGGTGRCLLQSRSPGAKKTLQRTMAARPLGTSGSPSRRRVATAAPPPMNRATTLMERTKGTATA